jgi:hypothetical protein
MSLHFSLTEHHAMKAYWFHAPAASLPGKSSWYPLDWRLGWPQSRSGRGGEEKNSQPLPGLEPQTTQPVSQRYTTDLSRYVEDR